MGPVATVVAIGFLEALRWLLWITAGLLLVLIVVQALRGDAAARPLINLALAAGLGVAGYGCARASQALIARARK